MPSTNGYGSSGVPDIIASYRGKFIGIELEYKYYEIAKESILNINK